MCYADVATSDYSRGYGKVTIEGAGESSVYGWATKETQEVEEEDSEMALVEAAAEEEETSESTAAPWVPARFYYSPVRDLFAALLSKEDPHRILEDVGMSLQAIK